MGRRKKNYDSINPSEEYIKANRTFPTGKTVLLVLCIIAQICIILFLVFYQPTPQDIIKEYNVTAEPKTDGTLDITYSFVWEAKDEDEPLTWVEIGIANDLFGLYESSISDTVNSYTKFIDEDYVSLRLYFKRSYIGGEEVRFSFKINQQNMLCKDESGYFYQFVPGWFNAIPVEHYKFEWKDSLYLTSSNADREAISSHIWEGSLKPGEYVIMDTRYTVGAFTNASTVEFEEFNDRGCKNELISDKIAVIFLGSIPIIVLFALELTYIDSHVSYKRGRGFLVGYGHHMHTYGRINPKYKKAAEEHTSTYHGTHGRGGFGGGGCACACACACAGGGRAGCSQKDTYSLSGVEKHIKAGSARPNPPAYPIHNDCFSEQNGGEKLHKFPCDK